MLRVWAVVAGVLGVAAAITGGAGLIARPDAIVWASAPLDRPVVVIPPQVLAMDGVLEIVVEGEPYTEIRTALPVDAYAWLRGESSIVVRGVSSWTEVTLVRPQIYTYDGNEMTGDIWRSNIVRYGAMHIRPADVPPGLAVVVITRSHTPLDKVSIQLSRDPGYEWAWPTISAGALLARGEHHSVRHCVACPGRAPGGCRRRRRSSLLTPARKPKGPKSKEQAPSEVLAPEAPAPEASALEPPHPRRPCRGAPAGTPRRRARSERANSTLGAHRRDEPRARGARGMRNRPPRSLRDALARRTRGASRRTSRARSSPRASPRSQRPTPPAAPQPPPCASVATPHWSARPSTSSTRRAAPPPT